MNLNRIAEGYVLMVALANQYFIADKCDKEFVGETLAKLVLALDKELEDEDD